MRLEDAMQWQEQWANEELCALCLGRGSTDAATGLTLLMELAQALGATLVSAGWTAGNDARNVAI